MENKINLKTKNLIMVIVAGIINAIGVTIFLFPVKLYDSGISGLSMLLDQITPKYLTLPIFLILLNVPIFIFGLKKQGKTFTVYSVISVAVYSLVSFLITKVLPIDLSFASPLAEKDLLLCAIFGGTISGVGSGLVIRNGGAIDGVEILSVLFAKKIGITIGTFVLIFNLLLYTVCGIIFQSWILPLYSILTYFAGSKTVDFIVDGIDRNKCAMIITTKPKEVSKALADEFGTSGTFVDAIGGYSKDKKSILYFVINHFQINKLKNIVLTYDENAFISTLEVSEVIKKTKNQ